MSSCCQEYHIKHLYEVNTGPNSLYKLALSREPVFLINAWVQCSTQALPAPSPSGFDFWLTHPEPLCLWVINAPDVSHWVWEGRNKSQFQLTMFQPEHGAFIAGTDPGCPAEQNLQTSASLWLGLALCVQHQVESPCGLWGTVKGVSSQPDRAIILKAWDQSFSHPTCIRGL